VDARTHRISASRNAYIAAIHTMVGQLTEATVNGWTHILVRLDMAWLAASFDLLSKTFDIILQLILREG
jgi:hypothetical protein